jgi:suppressor for copper-sensitivity B
MALARLTTLLVLSTGLIMSTGSARAAATDWVGDSRAAVRLITAADNVTADSTLEAGLEFRFAKGWHGYWRTPGDAGIPPAATGLLRKIFRTGKSPGPLHIVS